MTAIRRAAHRRKRPLRIPLAATAAIAATATGLSVLALADTDKATAAAGSDALQRQFTAAATEFHVPQSVLLALSYQQTRWESHHGEPSTTGNYNVMGLVQVDPAAVNKQLAKQQTAPSDTLDGRGDDAKPIAPPADQPEQVKDSPALHTLDAAAKLIHRPAADLKKDSGQSIRGGAALLVQYQKDAGKTVSTNPADWYGALAKFSQAGTATPAGSDTASANAFADRVFKTLHDGAARLTSEGQSVTLAADANIPVAKVKAAPRVTPRAVPQGTVECPVQLNCDFQPAAYALTNPSDQSSFGNYSVANRPDDGDKIQYIVIHDTEGGYSGSIQHFQNPSAQASAHYIVRASDGHVTQLVNDQNVAWHAGNKTLNMHSIGVEHEGFAFPPDNAGATWYSEQLYAGSATLVSWLAAKYNIPLDRQHIIGHDDVPGPTQALVAGMHWDPGTFWDWNHYLDLLGAPVKANTGGSLLVGGKVTITPAFDNSNTPVVTGSSGSYTRPENFVYLRTQPDQNAPLINSGTTNAADWHDKAAAGTSYVVADQQGDWTAIWYDGQKAWFYNPNGTAGSADNRLGQTLLTPAGSGSIPVYGRTYPEAAAYQPYPGITAQTVQPLSATIAPGQAYVAASDSPVQSDFYYAWNINGDAPNDRTLVVGKDTYYPIRFNHRLAFLKSTDVKAITATTPAPSGYTPAGPVRLLDTRYGTGAPQGQVAANSAVTLQVTGGNTGVPADATGVILNVTAVSPTAPGFVTVYPDGQPRPLASNLNFTAGQVIPNLVVVPVVNGNVKLYSAGGSLDLVADLMGYYSPSGSSKFSTLTPTRLLDTRYGTGAPQGQVASGGTVKLQVAGNPLVNVPASATGVVLNVTVTGPSHDGFVTVYPDGAQRPTASNLNFTAGQTIPNQVIVPITNGTVDLYNAGGNADLIADITGYYSPSGTSTFTSAGPTRLLDTRNGTGGTQGPVGQKSTISLQVAGKAGLPTSGVTAVVLNVTAVTPSADGFVTVFPDGTSLPGVSNLNFTAGEVIPNLVVVPVTNGKVDFYNAIGNVDLVADITGYYTSN